MSGITTIAKYTNLAIKGLQEPFKLAIQHRLEQYKEQEFVNFYNTNEWTEIFSSLEGARGTRKLGELETPDVAALEQGYTKSLSPQRAGVGMIVSQDTMIRAGDDTTKIDRYLFEERDQLLKDVENDVLLDAFAPYNNAFESSNPKYPAPDGVALCGTHTYKGGGTFVNGITDVFSEQAVDKAWEYAGAFKDQSGKPMPLNWTAILVKKGSPVSKAAKQLFANGITPTAVNDINIYEGSLRVVETPYLTNKNNYFFIDGNIMNSPVILGMVKTPTFEDPITLENQSIRSNIIGYWKNGINKLPLNVYGSSGTGL